MDYHSFMGYGMQIPANQVGGLIQLWDITGYGLLQVWVMAVRLYRPLLIIDPPYIVTWRYRGVQISLVGTDLYGFRSDKYIFD